MDTIEITFDDDRTDIRRIATRYLAETLDRS